MAKDKTVSYSQYSIYKQCPHRWYLDYVKKLQPFKPSVHLIFGTAFHETLQNYLKVMYEESAATADKIHLPTYFKTRFMELYKENSTQGHFSTPEELSEFFEDATAILDFVKRKRGLFFKKMEQCGPHCSWTFCHCNSCRLHRFNLIFCFAPAT